MPTYLTIPDQFVPNLARAEAQRELARQVKALGLVRQPVLHWIDDIEWAPPLARLRAPGWSPAVIERPFPIHGLALRGVPASIFIHARLRLDRLLDAVIHEARHAAQYQWGWAFSDAIHEQDAYGYAATVRLPAWTRDHQIQPLYG